VGWQRGEKSAFSGIKKIDNNKKWQFWGRTLSLVKFSPAKLGKSGFHVANRKNDGWFCQKNDK